MLFYWIFVFFQICQIRAYVINKFDTEPDVKKISAAYFKEHQDIVGYETSAKLIFRVQLPPLEYYEHGVSLQKGAKNDTFTYIDRTTATLVEDFWKHLRGLRKRRGRRQLLVGTALVGVGAIIGYKVHSIYTSIANEFSGSERDAQDRINELRTAMARAQNENLMFMHNITEFSNNLAATVDKLGSRTDEFERNDLWILHLIQLHIAITRIENGLDRCVDKHIPLQLLTGQELVKRLKELESSVLSKGYHFALPTTDIVSDESLKIADCYVTDSNIYVLVNIPVTSVAWRITEMIPIPFANFNTTCSLEKIEPEVLAISRDRMVVVDNYMRTSCDLVHDRMCLIPSFSHPSIQDMACTSSLYQQADVKHVMENCNFKCVNSSSMQIAELDKNTIIVTFAKKIVITCPNEKKTYTVPLYGAMRLSLKCNCTYIVDGFAVGGAGLCLDELFHEDDVSLIIPYFVNNPDETLGKNRTTWVKLAKFSPSISTDVVMETQVIGFHYRDFWLGVLSVVLVIAVVAICVIAYYVRKLQ